MRRLAIYLEEAHLSLLRAAVIGVALASVLMFLVVGALRVLTPLR